MMNNVLFLGLVVVTFLVVTGTPWSHDHQVIMKEGHRLVVEFEEGDDGNTKVVISQPGDRDSGADGGSTSCPMVEFFDKATEMTKNMVSGRIDEARNTFRSLEQHTKEVVENAVEKVSESKEKLREKAESVAKDAVPAGMFKFSESTKGALKDSMVKMQNWDPVESPKRIGEDIERNITKEVEIGVEELKKTVETIKENSWSDLFRKMIHNVLLEKIREVVGWCHLLGFSTAYGMGMWVTFLFRCVLEKCNLPNHEFEMLLNKMNLVYFRAMAYCVGAAVLGFLVQSQGRKGVRFSSNKMEIFQGFNLLYAFLTIFTNLIFLEPRATKLIVKRKKTRGSDEHTKISEVAEKLKKLNASTHPSCWILTVSMISEVAEKLKKLNS